MNLRVYMNNNNNIPILHIYEESLQTSGYNIGIYVES